MSMQILNLCWYLSVGFFWMFYFMLAGLHTDRYTLRKFTLMTSHGITRSLVRRWSDALSSGELSCSASSFWRSSARNVGFLQVRLMAPKRKKTQARKSPAKNHGDVNLSYSSSSPSSAVYRKPWMHRRTKYQPSRCRKITEDLVLPWKKARVDDGVWLAANNSPFRHSAINLHFVKSTL